MNAQSVTSMKQKATSVQFAANVNMASSSTSQPIKILTDSESKTNIQPLPKHCLCECLCLHLQMHTSLSAAEPDLNPDTPDAIPEIPRPFSTQG